jgi:hypothetical protein
MSCSTRPADLVADGPDDVDALAGRVVQGPVFVALARVVGRLAATHGDDDVGGFTASVVRILGHSAAMSMPSSAMAWMATGVDLVDWLAASGSVS